MKPLTQEPVSNSVTSQLRRLRVDVVLISSDDSFLIELGPLLGDHYRTHTVDSPLALGNLAHKTGWLAIVDVAAVAEAQATVTRMAQRYPHAPIIVVTPKAADWSSQVSRGAIVDAFAREELGSTRFSEALSKAVARLQENPQTEPLPSGSYRDANPFDGGPHISLPTRALPIAAVMIALLAAGLWFWHRSGGPHSSRPAQSLSTTTSTTPSPASPQLEAAPGAPPSSISPGSSSSQTILELLSAARVQFHDQKLQFPRPDGEPRGDSALELYAQVLSQDPSNAEALDGIGRLWAIAKQRIQGDIASGKLEDASRLIALFKAAGLSDELVQPLNAGVIAARPRWLQARAQQSIDAGDLSSAEQLIGQLVSSGADADTLLELRRAMDAKHLEQQLSALSTQMQNAIAAGTLLTPEGASAMARLSAMRTLSRSHTVTQAAQRELRAALLTQATQAIQQQQFDVATRYVSAASDLGSSGDVADIKRQLQQAEDRATQAQQAAVAPAPPPSSPAPELAPSAPSPVQPSFIAATPVRPLDVSYPQNVGSLEGRVVVEFTLHANGSASDPVVIDAKPRGVFDRAALAAVRRGRFDTNALAGASTQRARISLHFKPE